MSIILTKVLYAYPGLTEPTINISSLSVAQSEHVFLYGDSGCGKSTLLNLLSGILKPNQGHIELCGQDTTGMSNRLSTRFRANNIGYIFQQFNLIPYLNPIENIQLSNYFSSQANISLAAIEDWLNRLNLQQNQWLKPVKQLSIGQQQRVAIARAMVNQPQLILADEPTSALDQANRDAFIELLQSITEAHHMTLVFVSHDQTLAKHFSAQVAFHEINQPPQIAHVS